MGKNLEKETDELELLRKNYFFNLNLRKKEALERYNPVVYYSLCNELCLDQDSLEDPLLYERGKLEFKENIRFSKGFVSRKKVSKSTYLNFLKEVNEKRLRPLAILTDINQKKNLLKNVMNYPELKTKEGYKLIDDCDDSRIGQAFMNTYKSACRATGLRY